jgi:two-component system cell cycle sensor histidine kinase/response regulator CckA
MKHHISYPHIFFALLATLILAGLFYLPYLAVRNKTIETFRTQQIMLAQQAGSDIQAYFATYEKALAYLVLQPSIQTLDENGKTLLRNFLSIHPEDISGVQRIDSWGSIVFSVPEESDGNTTSPAHFCQQMEERRLPMVSDVMHLPNGEQRIFFSAAVRHEDRFDGCLSFSLPFTQVAARYLEQMPLHHSGSVILFSRGGNILYAPDVDLNGKSIGSLHGNADDHNQLRDNLRKREPGIVLLSGDPLDAAPQAAKKMFAVSFPVELPGPTSWSMLMATPAQEVLGAMAEFRTQWLLVTSVAIVSVGLLSFFLSGIVAKRREEQRLRAVEEQLAGLLDLAPMGVFLLGSNDVVVYANKEAVRMVEAEDAGSVTGCFFIDFIQKDCRRMVARKIREQVSGQAISINDAKLLSRNKAERDIVITATPYQLDDQEQCIIIVRDISEERKAEEQLRRLAAAIDQVKESVLIANREGGIEYVNAVLGEMTGYDREESCGQSVRLLWAKEQDAYFEQQIEDVVHRGEVWRGRIVNRRKDTSLFVTAATVSPVRDASGKVTHFVAVQRDITHEVEVESRMRQAQKMEAIGTLAGGIAHDFNNILGGIIGFTDMALLQSTPESELHNNLLHIRQGGKRAADLVQQILTFSRQSVEEKRPVRVVPLILESLKLLRATLPSTIDIVQELTATDAMVLAAPVQIHQIVMNLCANAFSSMRDKGGHLGIRLQRVTADECGKAEEGHGGNWVELKVEDTGHGIDSENIQRIFTPFFTTKQPGEGTGMGLSVVHGIVKELGGDISVQSQRGEGTTFTVLLPVAGEGRNGALLSSEAPLPTGTEHVLVVDDEKEIRETCRMMLSHLGYTVTTAATPLEVMNLIEAAQPRIDLVITDQTMPKMTGVELTRKIRLLYPDIPVVLCTGYSDRLNYDIARESGACDLVMKPVDLRGLGTAVRAALDMSS